MTAVSRPHDGLDQPPELPGWSRRAKFRAIGNAVPLPMGRTLARAVRAADSPTGRECVCGCGRLVKARRSDQRSALPACRKRLERRRREHLPTISLGSVSELHEPAVTSLRIA